LINCDHHLTVKEVAEELQSRVRYMLFLFFVKIYRDPGNNSRCLPHFKNSIDLEQDGTSTSFMFDNALMQCCGYGMFIPDLDFCIPDPDLGSRGYKNHLIQEGCQF
jgi:hypothetical protein